MLNNSKYAVAVALLGLAMLPAFVSAATGAPPVISWGMGPATPGAPFRVAANRVGCGASLKACLVRNTAGRSANDTRVALTFPASRSPDDVLSAIEAYVSSEPAPGRADEIGLDDFATIVKRGVRTDTMASLGRIPAVIARAQPAPRLAATVYEDDLSYLESLKDADLTRFMDGVQRVAFFLHHRAEVDGYSAFLPRIRRLFPKAEIFGGLYHYDRADYLPCHADSRARCTDAEEYALFLASVDATLDAFRQGHLAGIELYPGRIGQEAAWEGWSKPRTCRPSRQAECIAVSQRMGQALVKKLEAK